VDLHGRILDVTEAHPFGSKADITLFRESDVPEKLDSNTRAIAPAPVNLKSRVEARIEHASETPAEEMDELDTKHSDLKSQRDYVEDDAEEEKTTDFIPTISHALTELKALGDKAYYGSELIYVPHKQFKGKRFTKTKRDFNKLLSSKRVIVENVNKRLEDFRVIGTIYRGGMRDRDTVSKIVRVLASLHNFTLGDHPLRRQRHKAQELAV